MIRRSRNSCFFVFVTLMILSRQWTEITCQVTSGPANTGALLGDEVQLNCTVTGVTVSSKMAWEYTNDVEPTGDRIYTSPNTETADETRFGIDMDEAAGDYNIIVKAVTFPLAAAYACIYLDTGGRLAAELIALDSVQCPQPGDTPVSQGSVENMTCTVEYSGKVILPTLKWTDADGTDLGGVENPTTPRTDADGITQIHQLSKTYSVELQAENDGQEFTCTVAFETGDAAGTPEYSESCTTVYLVTHPVTEVTLSLTNVDGEEDYPSIPVGDTINCTADGRPEPDLSWVSESGDVIMGSDLTITEDMVSTAPQTWTCNASNTVDDVTATASANVTFYASDANTDEVVQSGTESWVIAVAVVVPIVCITLIAIAVFLFIRHRRKAKGKGPGGKSKTNGGTGGGGGATEPMLSTTTTTTSQPPIYGVPNRGQNPTPRVNYNYSSAPNGGHRVSGIDSPGYADLGVRPNGSTASINRSNGSVTMNPNPRGFPQPANGSTTGVILRPTSSTSSTSSRAPSYGRLDYDPSGLGPAQPRSPRSDTSSVSQGSAV